MEMLEEMRALLREKTACFLLYEEETRKMISDEAEDVDQITAAIEARQRLIEKIDGIDGEIKKIRDSSPSGARLYGILKNECDYRNLSGEEKRLFSDGQELFKIMTRIHELEIRAAEGMGKILDELQEKIKKSNVNSRFTGYLKQMDQGAKGMLYDRKR